MMQLGTRRCPTPPGTGWRAVEIPYIGGSLAMTVIVPDDLATFEQALDGRSARRRSRPGSRETQVTLTFPKFSIETKAELADVLAALGMPTAFDPAAPTSPGSRPPSSSSSPT